METTETKIWVLVGYLLVVIIIVIYFIMAANIFKAKEFARKQYEILILIALKNGVELDKIKEVDKK